MSEKRYVFIQKEDFHTVKDTESGKPLIVEKFKENEFGRYCCFHRIIDLLNEQDERIKQLEFQLEYQRQLENKISRLKKRIQELEKK